MRRLHAVLAVLTMQACGEPTNVDSASPSPAPAAGAYVLEHVDGRPLEATGYGSLRLTPSLRDSAARFEWEVFSALTPGGAVDAGAWTQSGTEVRFQSRYFEPSDYGGQFAATPAPMSDAAPAGARVTLRRLAGVTSRIEQTYTFRRVRSAPDTMATARLAVRVTDPEGRLVSGTLLIVRHPDGLVTRLGTTGAGPTVLGGPPGMWEVTVTPPRSYALAPGQAGQLRVAVPAQPEPTTLLVRLTI
jgi:hypothetical protein